MSVVLTILITIHQDVFAMPTTPTTEMTALSEKRVRGILHLLGRKEGFEEKREEFAKVVGWKRSKISNLGSRKLSRGRMGNNRQENMGISDE